MVFTAWIITSIDGMAVRGMEELAAILEKYEPGDVIVLEIQVFTGNNYEVHNIEVELGSIDK